MHSDRIASLRSRLHAVRREAFGGIDPTRPPARHAATLIPIVEDTAGLRTIVFERTHLVADHKGEICFPGGSIEPEDRDPAAAALRETNEELGVPAADVEILGMLEDVRTIGSNYVITPVVGLLRALPAFIADEREVARVMVISIDALCDAAARRRETIVIRGSERDVDTFPVAGGRIWGATLRTLDLLCAAMHG